MRGVSHEPGDFARPRDRKDPWSGKGRLLRLELAPDHAWGHIKP